MLDKIQKNFTLFSVTVITVISLIAYSNTFKSDFQFDDGAHIIESEKIMNLSNYLTARHWMDIDNRPLAHFTLAINHKLSEKTGGVPGVTGFHIFNLLIHILTGIFTFLLVREIFRTPVGKKLDVAKYSDYIALFTALIMVAHPIQTQAVTYIVQRMTSMAGMFYILAAYFYTRGRNAQIYNEFTSAKQIAFLAYALIAGFLGFLSKQTAITFPLALLLVEVSFIRDNKGKVFKQYLLAVSGVIAVVFLLGIIMVGIPKEVESITRGQYLLTQFKVIPKYIQLAFLPINQNVDYYWPISKSFGTKEILGLAFLLVLIAGAVFLFKKYRLISFGIFWFFIAMLIESSLIPIRDVIFEHRLYLPLLGFALILSYLVFKFLTRKSVRYAIIAIILLIPVYAAATLNRNEVWKTRYSLWSDAVKKAPQRERAWYWLGSAYNNDKEYDKALEAFDKAIENNPVFSMAYNARGNVKKQLKDRNGALADYNKAITLKPGYGLAHYNRGVLKAEMRKYEEAVADYDQAIKYGYINSSIYYNRGNSKLKMKKAEDAIKDYQISLSKRPGYTLAMYNMGLAYAELDEHLKAVQVISQAITLDPKNHLFYNGRGVSEIALKQYDRAIKDFDTSIKLNSTFGQAYYNRGYAKFFGLNDKDGACADWKKGDQYRYPAAKSMLKQHCGITTTAPATKQK